MKEVTEALLPGTDSVFRHIDLSIISSPRSSCVSGGSLNPPTKALNPLLTCVGGVVGPIIMYVFLISFGMTWGWFDDEQARGTS